MEWVVGFIFVAIIVFLTEIKEQQTENRRETNQEQGKENNNVSSSVYQKIESLSANNSASQDTTSVRGKDVRRNVKVLLGKKDWVYTPEELFRTEYISFTRLKTFIECPKKFEIIYLKKKDPNFDLRKRVSVVRGKLVHKILEIYVRRNIGQFPDCLALRKGVINDILDYCSEAKLRISNECDSEVLNRISRKELMGYIQNFVELNFPGRIVGRMLGDECQYVPPFVYAEKHIFLNIDGYNFKAIIDRIDFYPTAVSIIDYKTGKPNFSYLLSQQLEFYSYLLDILLRKSETKLPIYMECQFLKNGKSYGKFYESDGLIVESIVNKILSTVSFERKYSYRCNWCPVKNFCD
jgi:RecB family exonuclease